VYLAVTEVKDPFSESKFGAAVVTVTIQEGFAPPADTLADVFDEPVKKKRRKLEDDETHFERIQRMSSKKGLPPKKKKKGGGSYEAAMERLHTTKKKVKRGQKGYGNKRNKFMKNAAQGKKDKG
jgi:hypothetical protein